MAEVKAWQLQRPRKHANGRVARTTGVMAETAGDAGAWTTRLAPHSPRPRLFLFARGPGPGFALVTPLQEPPHRRAPQHAADGEDHHRQRKQDAQVRDVLAKQINDAEAKVMPRHVERVSEAKRRLIAELDEELARLVALQAVNPSVRDSEINALREQREQSLAMFDKAALRLEAIRVLVAG